MSPPPKQALCASSQLFFTKASSPRTEQPQPKSSLGKHEATVQAKATAPQVPEDAISFLHGGPPKPKENSSVGTERIGDRRLHVDINVPKPKAPAKAGLKLSQKMILNRPCSCSQRLAQLASMGPKKEGRLVEDQRQREQAGLSWKSASTLERQRKRARDRQKGQNKGQD